MYYANIVQSFKSSPRQWEYGQ